MSETKFKDQTQKDKKERFNMNAQFLKRKESWSGIEPRSFRLSAYRLTARPNRLSSSSNIRRFFYNRHHCQRQTLWAGLA